MAFHKFPPILAKNFNWSTYRTTPLTYTLDHLSLCSKLAIDPYTLELSKHLCTAISIPSSGRQNIAQAVEHGSLATTAGSKEGGEDVQKLIQGLAVEDGLSFLGLCAVLGTYYPLESILAIFGALLKESAAPEDLVPTSHAWESLRPLFEVLSAPKGFGEMVDELTALGANEIVKEGKEGLKHGGALGVVETLVCMSRLANSPVNGGKEEGEGKEEDKRNRVAWLPKLTSSAGCDAGWVAAVTEWVFGLKVELRGRFTGEVSEESLRREKVLWGSCGEGEKTTVCVRFAPPGRPVDGEVVVETPLRVRERN